MSTYLCCVYEVWLLKYLLSLHDTMLCKTFRLRSGAGWELPLFSVCLSALQSPIEYQRRESKSNSLGRSMRPPLSAASALRPHSSASIDRHKLPSLHSHNTSLPALYLPSQGQGQGLNETYSVRDVGFFSCLFLWPWPCFAVTTHSNT